MTTSTASTATASILSQVTAGNSHLSEHISSHLRSPGLKRFRAAVSYARWDGLGLIAHDLEKFLGDGGEFQSIYGVNNGVTTPDSFLYSLYLREISGNHSYAGSIEDQFANATFHSKFFEFSFADRIVAIVGSANLTGGGFSRNIETAAEITVDRKSDFANNLDGVWKCLKEKSDLVTLDKIRELKKLNELSSENFAESIITTGAPKPYLNINLSMHPKPLFSKILDLKKPVLKSKILSSFDPLTDRPKNLYLEIFETETGGQGSQKGYQVQLPSATLAAYFGVAPSEERIAVFHFGKERIETPFTHFSNNTHRVRLRPILDAHRPAVLTFERIGDDEYKCSITSHKNYAATLSSKCNEQTRSGARRWGME